MLLFTRSLGLIILIFVIIGPAVGRDEVSALKYRKVILEKKKNQEAPLAGSDSFYDPSYDYSRFTARITDRDKSHRVYKVSSENKNIAFFHTGDQIRFRPPTVEDYCEANIRSVEKGYIVIYVNNIKRCWKRDAYLRRGSIIVIKSETLAERVRDASIYRHVLLKRKGSYYQQFNNINHFIWSYEQKRIQVAEEYDQKIADLEKEKMEALEQLRTKKNDSIRLQKELTYRLDGLDKDLQIYRVKKDDLHVDRWHLDHDLGLPVQKRPESMKFID